MELNIATLVSALADWGWWAYLLLAALILVEGPAFTLLAGVAASTGHFSVPLVFLAAAGGNLTGDTLWYSLGRLGRLEWITHHGRRFGLRPEVIVRLRDAVHTHAERLLFTGKLTLGMMIPTLVAAGLARVPWRRAFAVLGVAECVWSGGLITCGYFFGQSIQNLQTGLQWVTLGGSVVMVVLISRYIAQHAATTGNAP
jgi:membrane protein DedA with SNARE-associated domain